MRKTLLSAIAATSLLLAGCAGAPNNGAGQGLGAVAGGLLGGIAGNQIGSGSGNTWATGVGAGLGAVLGSEVGRGYDRSIDPRPHSYHSAPRSHRSQQGYTYTPPTTSNPGVEGAWHRGRSQYKQRQQHRMENDAYQRGRRGY